MIPAAFLARLLLLLAVFNKGILARRGGGDHDDDGDSSSDYGSGSSGSGGSDSSDTSDGSDGSSSGSSPSYCANPPSSVLDNSGLIPTHAVNWTSQAGARSARTPSIYDGSYFQGEGQLSYNITNGPQCEASKQLRLLGYGWIAPQPPYPKGAENPFIIGFKAWKSDNAVSEIHTSHTNIKWEGDKCASEPDLFRIATTRGSVNLDYAEDVMLLDVSTDSATSNAVTFNATTSQDLERTVSSYEGLFRLRAGTCLPSDTNMKWANTTTMEGSVTNTTMELKFSGSVDLNSTQSYRQRDEDLKVNFTITFSGQFDSANSTHALQIQPGNQTLTWKPNNAVRGIAGGWAYRFGCIVGIQIIIWWLW